MNKKEISELKKQFTPDNCTISRICGCYVDSEKEKRLEMRESFLSLSDEEMFKYFEIFKKTLSGTIGKNLLNLEFPLKAEAEGGEQEFLLRLKNSRLTDDALVDECYNKIIEHYYNAENYFIILVHAAYDVPGKAKDNTEMFDSSDEVYEYILCCICPVRLSKAGLCYNEAENRIRDRIRDWIVELPERGFLFPAFHDRSTDLHAMLYYSKKPEELHIDSKISVISGFSDFKYTRLAIQAGVIDYILKPVDPQNLNNALSATISQLESEAGKTGTSDSASSPEPCSAFTSRVISDVFDYINAHYLENISLADIAESFFYVRSICPDCFKKTSESFFLYYAVKAHRGETASAVYGYNSRRHCLASWFQQWKLLQQGF